MSIINMDLIDQEFMESIFPQYLLKQPVAHELWKLYYTHKKLFHKLRTKDEILNADLDHMEAYATQEFRNSNRLSLATRREIWEKLSQLGVLGTIPYDSLSDEYLVQVHKYFYARSDEKSGTPYYENVDMSKPAVTEEELLENMIRESDGSGEDEGEDDENDENDENSEEYSGYDEEPEIHENITEHSDDENGANNHSEVDSSSRSSKTRITFHPEVKESKYPIQLKSNPISGDIYKSLGYSLPHKWVVQSDNSILVSQDGCTMLRVNPNWHALSSYGRASPIMNSRLRVNINSQKKQQWATTWANNGLHHAKCAIFYFEIRVLSVTSSQAGRNSHVLVGFKNWAKVQEKTGLSENDSSNIPSVPSTSHSNMLRNAFDGNRNSASPSSSSSHSQLNEVETFSYSGLDGNKSDGSGSQKYSRPFKNDDIIGCGVNFLDGTIFFTKNGMFLGNAFTDICDIDLVPFVSIKSGNSIRTNFGLSEEFLFDIDKYQLQWKYKSFSHVFKTVDGEISMNLEEESDVEDFEKFGSLLRDQPMDTDMDLDSNIESTADSNGNEPCSNTNTENIHDKYADGYLLSSDTRFSGDKLWKPDTPKINNLNPNDDSIPSFLNSVINDYLIHEGYIDVAKGFLKDLQRDCIQNNTDERAKFVIRHNERQISKEEKNLQIRQTIRRYISAGDILRCMKYIEQEFPLLLNKHLDLTFEMKCADYLLCLSHQSPENDMIESILNKGQIISSEFLQNVNISPEQRDIFRTKFNEISPLMAYSNPSLECTDDRSFYLTPAYLQERLFQTINAHILQYLEKKSQSSLENVIGYTRAMVNTLMEYGPSGGKEKEPAYYKLMNIDEDLLKL